MENLYKKYKITKILTAIKNFLFYIFLADCSSCKYESNCMKNDFMCGFIGGVNENYYEKRDN